MSDLSIIDDRDDNNGPTDDPAGDGFFHFSNTDPTLTVDADGEPTTSEPIYADH
ncbi:MAG TPA: hypothetical protein VK694_08230 [Verrucomicrobiae bacterium]|nr:hypothetical protein [Verrucomicrobiae bacterium]